MIRGMKKRDKKWMWVTKPGDRCYTLKAIIQERIQGIGRGREYMAECLEMCFPRI
jgi:hypothetical protein